MSIKFKKILTIGIQLKARKNFKQKYEYQRISNFPCSNFVHNRFFVGRIASPPKLIFLNFSNEGSHKRMHVVQFFSYFHTISLQALSIYRLTLTKKRLFRQIIMSHIWDYFKGKTPFFRINTIMVSSIFITEPHYVRNFLVQREKNGNFENNLVVRLI